MARLSMPAAGEAIAVEQPIEAILEQLLQSPPPEEIKKAFVPSCGALLGKPLELAVPAQKIPVQTPRTYRPQQNKAKSQPREKHGGKELGKFALAAASPIALLTDLPRRKCAESKKKESKASSASLTGRDLSDASLDSVELQSHREDHRAFCPESQQERPLHRTYWPKYEMNGDAVNASNSQDGCKHDVLVQKYYKDKITPEGCLSGKSIVRSSVLPVPIDISAVPDGQYLDKPCHISQDQTSSSSGSRSSTPSKRKPSSHSSDEDTQQAYPLSPCLLCYADFQAICHVIMPH